MANESDFSLQSFRDHAWDYFELHADQRLKTFHFYILLETGLVAAMLVAARAGLANAWTFCVIGLFMILLSFVFWKLDQRTKGMVKLSEEALKVFEGEMVRALNTPGIAEFIPFSNDPQARGLVENSPFGTMTYSKCFGIVFIAFGVLGGGIAAALTFFKAVAG